MKKYILILLCQSYFLYAYGQVVNGTLLDEITKEAIPFASVYYDQTLQGTVADMNGNFKLETSRDSTIPLVVSAIGYYSTTISNYSNCEIVKVYLKPKVYNIDEVIISAKSIHKERKRYMRIFRQEFLGTTANAKNCTILNEKDITFNYGTNNDTLIAYALKPILIENKALGYTITYYLDKFERYKNSYTCFVGSFIFTEDFSENEVSVEAINRNREISYYGSRMHFIRILHTGNIKESSRFRVSNKDKEKLVVSDFIIKNDQNQLFLKNVGDILIKYDNYESSIKFSSDLVFIDKTGYFNPDGILWSGDLSEHRMADCLPFEYLPEQ